MSLHAGPLRTGIFNVADVAIMAGVLWLLFGGLITRGGEQKAGDEPA